jgi:putative phage-type endonuclease
MRDHPADPFVPFVRLSVRPKASRTTPLAAAEALKITAGVLADLYPVDSLAGPFGWQQIERPAAEADWLELRRPFFNASAAAALFHEHPFLTLADVVRSKLDPSSVILENAAMRRGRHLEAAVADWWADDHGVAIYEPDVLYSAWPLMATLDRRIVGNDTDAVEIKTTAKHINAPERYWWWQCQAQMHCAELERVHLAVLDASMNLATYVVERDDDAIGRLVDAALDVMNPVVRYGEWPACVAHDPPPRHADRIVELDADGVAELEAWLVVRAQIADLEAVEEAHKRRLTEVLGDAQAATVDGRQVLTYRSHTRSSIDLTRLRVEHAELAAELSSEQVVRVLRPTRTR